MSITNLPYNGEMNFRAKELRREMTQHERKLWYLFLRKYPVKIYKQRVINSFIADFYCPAARLVIELDGSQHYTDQGEAYDKERDTIIEKYGVVILRFSNLEIDRCLILFANVSMIQYTNVLLNWNVMLDLPPLLGEEAKPRGFDGEVLYLTNASNLLA